MYIINTLRRYFEIQEKCYKNKRFRKTILL